VSCFAGLSLTQLQAADYVANTGQHYIYNNIIDTGSNIDAFNGGRLDFNSSTFYDASLSVSSNTAESWIGVFDSTVYADRVLIVGDGVYSQGIAFENSSLYVTNDIIIGQRGSFNMFNGNLKANVSGFNWLNRGGMHLQDSNFEGTVQGLEHMSVAGTSTWKITGYSSLSNLDIYSEGSLTIEFDLADEHGIIHLGNLYIHDDATLTLNISLSDIFIEQMISWGDYGSSYIFNAITTSNYWEPGTFGDGSLNINMLTSNSNYKWDVTHLGDDFYEFSNFEKIPEPSTYAMIFGVLALGLAIYRRRK